MIREALMHRLAPISLGVAVSLALAAPLQAAEPSADERAVRAAFETVQQAIDARDIATLEQWIHPDFVMQHALGQSDTRDTWFAQIGAGTLARQSALRTEFGPTLTVAGDTALIRSLVRLYYPAEKRAGWLRSTTVFVRQDGRWLQINQQSGQVHEGPAEAPGNLEDFAGTYAIPRRDGFEIRPHDEYLDLVWANGAVLPLIPKGGDRFAAGLTSEIVFERGETGTVVSAIRTGNDGVRWWTAQRR